MGKQQSKTTLRQRQAQQTARMIVTAAKELFLEQGYSGTTIESIAARAGVAVSTVYAVFGSKRGILRAIRTEWHERSHIRDITVGTLGGDEPRERLEQLAQATRQQWETGAEVIAIYNGAATSDAEAAAELNQALAGRRKALKSFALGLKPHLRPGLDVTHAAAIVQALCLAEVYHELVRRVGWTGEEYQQWLAQALKCQLLERETERVRLK